MISDYKPVPFPLHGGNLKIQNGDQIAWVNCWVDLCVMTNHVFIIFCMILPKYGPQSFIRRVDVKF